MDELVSCEKSQVKRHKYPAALDSCEISHGKRHKYPAASHSIAEKVYGSDDIYQWPDDRAKALLTCNKMESKIKHWRNSSKVVYVLFFDFPFDILLCLFISWEIGVDIPWQTCQKNIIFIAIV
jgi:hypothetical protein